MPNYHRAHLEGATYFFTVVTYHRCPILTSPAAREILHAAWQNVQERFPFITVAICLLPDHIHSIWKLPVGDCNFSVRWKEIKRLFTRDYKLKVESTDERNSSRVDREEATIWQRRFWEHTIRDQDDLNRHLDYIHYNPVKHDLVSYAKDWPWSSFQRYVRMGHYPIDWGGMQEKEMELIDWGE